MSPPVRLIISVECLYWTQFVSGVAARPLLLSPMTCLKLWKTTSFTSWRMGVYLKKGTDETWSLVTRDYFQLCGDQESLLPSIRNRTKYLPPVLLFLLDRLFGTPLVEAFQD